MEFEFEFGDIDVPPFINALTFFDCMECVFNYKCCDEEFKTVRLSPEKLYNFLETVRKGG